MIIICEYYSTVHKGKMPQTPQLETLRQQLAEKLEVTVPAASFEELIKQLGKIVYNLIVNDMNRLLFILYRVDVDEQKVLKIIRENTLPEAAQLIAGALISRQLQKIQQRSESGTSDDIPEDEKW